MPFNSSLYHDAGQIQLELSQNSTRPIISPTRKNPSPAPLGESKQSGTACGSGLCLSASHDVVGGLREVRVAQYLYPDSTSTQAIVRLLEKNLASAP
jgi:hypothetical protein